jgi:peptidoglycan/xylan/chitin deacetylase (PgdA/CDA1 family)
VAFWLATALARRGRPAVVALYYHGVAPRDRERFRRQMKAIADRAIGADGIESAFRSRTWPPRVFVTFDDALDSVGTVVLPLLRRLRVPCTVFAVAGHLGRRPTWPVDTMGAGSAELTMSAADLRVSADVCAVGSHGTSHRPLTDLDRQEARQELISSRFLLEEATGKPIRDFAFPHGACDRALVETALACGYHRVFTLSPPPCGPEGVVIGRMKMTPAAWPIEFRLTAAGAYAWLPRWRRLVRRFSPLGAKVAP